MLINCEMCGERQWYGDADCCLSCRYTQKEIDEMDGRDNELEIEASERAAAFWEAE